MKGKVYFKKILIIWAICLLILTAIPITIGETSDSEITSTDDKNSCLLDSKHYSDCQFIVFGRCNYVTGPSIWKLGLYVPLEPKDFTFEAKGEVGEKLSVVVFGEEFGTFISYEHIKLEIFTATGVFYWGGQSLLLNKPRIFAFCNATDLWVYY